LVVTTARSPLRFRIEAHHISPEMKTPVPLVGLRAGQAVIAGFARFFDIVNGFFNRCRDASYWPGPARVFGRYNDALLNDV
jgi:hypothetical protein